MDASELELDAKLYKASSTLLEELQLRIPLLLYHPGSTPRRCRLRVRDSKCTELCLLLDRFQEWPQLLDPSLANMVGTLAEAFVSYIITHSAEYGPTRQRGSAGVSPLPRAISRLLYAFCKIRGYKVIVRLLNNEPKYMGVMLTTLRSWDVPSTGMTWEERYVMLLWLSHLMLAPFELANISIQDAKIGDMAVPGEFNDLPGIAGKVTALAFKHIGGSGKEREAGSILLVRLSLRKDMQPHDLPARLMRYATAQLLSRGDLVNLTPYHNLGYLSLIYGVMNAGAHSEVAPFLQSLYASTIQMATGDGNQSVTIRDSGPARKWLLKILRVTLTHGLSLSKKHGSIQDQQLNTMLEESIQHFLDALGDNDTPVRMAAAKGLSVIALNLDAAMSAQVVEAILACLQENILLEEPHTHKLIAITDKAHAEMTGLRRNIGAVDPLQWHGLMLALAHLLFRRSPPTALLAEILQALVLGLEFEQRSNVGTSIGVGVRDAACFGLWALARKYSTKELELVTTRDFADIQTQSDPDGSVLQLIAVKLAISACLDPSGNIRRGSSAALQELIGRHPDTITSGIPVVQVVDYHAVARLSRAMTEVAPNLAELGDVYRKPLLYALIEWRGTRAADVNQRRWAADALRILTRSLGVADLLEFADVVLGQFLDLKPLNIGTTAAARHGLLLGLASILDAAEEPGSEAIMLWLGRETSLIFDLKKLTGKIEGRMTLDIELVMEGVCTLIGQISDHLASTSCDSMAVHKWTSNAVHVVDHCIVAGTRDFVIQTSAEAFVKLFRLLGAPKDRAIVMQWLDNKKQSPSAFTSKGRLKAMSLIHAHLAHQSLHAELRQDITPYIFDIIQGKYKIETRADAMAALRVILTQPLDSPPEDLTSTQLSAVLQQGLTDYTNDQRGDIGSILRLQALETTEAYHNQHGSHKRAKQVCKGILPFVVKLASEKLNNVRFRAWQCLVAFWRTDSSLPHLQHNFQYPSEISTVLYFEQLMQLLSISWARKHLILGLVSSITSGTEDICRAASTALVAYVHSIDVAKRQELIATVSNVVMKELACKTAEDRQIVSLLEFHCFLADHDLFSTDSALSDDSNQDVWTTMQGIHGATSSLPRVEALLNVYLRLLSVDAYRGRAMDKLTRQLLHRWPKIRNTAADLLYLDSPNDILAMCDWNDPVSKTKPLVISLRKQLGVSSQQASKDSSEAKLTQFGGALLDGDSSYKCPNQ